MPLVLQHRPAATPTSTSGLAPPPVHRRAPSHAACTATALRAPLAIYDPLADHRPDEVRCPDWARPIEPPIQEIATDDCNYASLGQPSLRPLIAGERVVVEFWHLQLWSEEPAEAHVALFIGDWMVFEDHIAVPGDEAFYAPSAVVPVDMPTGTPVVFHLHNHGQNSWRLLRVDRLAP